VPLCHGEVSAEETQARVDCDPEKLLLTIKQQTPLPWSALVNPERERALSGHSSGGVTIPGGAQKTCGYGTSGHGLAGMMMLA